MIVLISLAVLALLVPLFGADTRDGLDWAKDNFWLRRRYGARSSRRDAKAARPVPAARAAANGHGSIASTC